MDIDITLNGEPRSVPAGLTLLGLLEHLGIDPSRVAVELNRAIVRRPDWPSTNVPAEAKLEVIEFVGGGAL
jgi:sulfur carrier protein